MVKSSVEPLWDRNLNASHAANSVLHDGAILRNTGFSPAVDCYTARETTKNYIVVEPQDVTVVAVHHAASDDTLAALLQLDPATAKHGTGMLFQGNSVFYSASSGRTCVGMTNSRKSFAHRVHFLSPLCFTDTFARSTNN